MFKKFAFVLVLAAAVCTAACAEEVKFSAVKDIFADGVKIGAQRASIAEGIAREGLGDKAKTQLTTYEKVSDVIAALKVGKVNATIMDMAPAKEFLKDAPEELTIMPEILSAEEYALALKKGNTELLTKIDAAITAIKEEGILDDIFKRYEADYASIKQADINLNPGGKNGKLYVGSGHGFPPYGMKVNDGYTGIDIELSAAIAVKLDMELVIVPMSFDAIPMALNSGKVDFAAAAMTVTEERKKNIDFSLPYVEAGQVVVVMTKNFQPAAAEAK